MPYINGKRVSNEEWTNQFGSLSKFHTGPSGENPADAPDIDPATQAPKAEKKAGNKRSGATKQKVTKAIAEATGTSAGDLPDITGLDAGTEAQ